MLHQPGTSQPTNFHVLCSDETHSFYLSPDGTYRNEHHDHEADQVVHALGGTRNACADMHAAFVAARNVFDAHRGIRDIPNLRFVNSGWAAHWIDERHICDHCSTTLKHLSGLDHQAAKYGVSYPRIDLMLRWLYETAGLPSSMYAQEHNEMLDLQAALPTFASPMQLRLLRDDLITAAFVVAALPFMSSRDTRDTRDLITHLSYLRQRGVRVQWLREVSTTVDPTALGNQTRDVTHFLVALTSARDLDAQEVAGRINTNTLLSLETEPHDGLFDGFAAARLAALRIADRSRGYK